MKLYEEYDRDSIRTAIESGLKMDLHMHSYWSDGTCTTVELINYRTGEGYRLLAITDHDGIEGSREGMNIADKDGVCFISGIELDSRDELGKDMHILGYGIDYDNSELADGLKQIRINREKRNEKLMSALNKKGYGITEKDVLSVNGGRYTGKPTFAKILFRKGFISSPDEAFRTVFKEDDIQIIQKETLETKDAIDLIHTAGGLAVMAHPMQQRRAGESLAAYLPRMYAILDRMREYGIDGIEVSHPSAGEVQKELLKVYARKYGLAATEGSDMHSIDRERDYSRYYMP